MKILSILCLGLLAAISTAMTLNAATIFSDLTPTGTRAVPSLDGEIGDEVTVTGSDWLVTALDIEIYSQGAIFPNGTPGYADFQARIYANDGSQGQPGSMLWQSSVVQVNYPGGLSLLNFDVPEVAVPDAFTWTLQYTDASIVPPALPSGAAPTIGAADACWTRGPDSPWGQVAAAGNLMAQIDAVPEPGPGILLSAGALILLLRRIPRSATVPGVCPQMAQVCGRAHSSHFGFP